MHFLLGVISEDEGLLDYTLEKYNQSLKVEPFPAYSRNIIIDDLLEFYAKYKLAPKKQQVSEYDNKSIIKDMEKTNLTTNTLLKAKTNFNILTEDQKEVYAQFAYDMFGAEEIDEKGNSLQYDNPNGMFDWYEIGGRWSNFLQLKDGTPTSSAKIKDIDFSTNSHTYTQNYNYAIRNWEILVEGKNMTSDEKDYYNQLVDYDFRSNPELFDKKFIKENFENKEPYATIQSGFSLPAFILDEEWYDISISAFIDIENKTLLNNIIKAPEYQDHYLTIIDCHV